MSIIDDIRERTRDPALATEASLGVGRDRRAPPASLEDVAAAEHDLGFPLPTLLRRLYCEVGNGGFGPGYGLIGLRGGTPDLDTGQKDIVSLYFSFCACDPKDPLWSWPGRLLPVANAGCGMYYCVDHQSAGSSIVWFEPNPHVDGESWNDSLIPLADSMERWLSAWLRGEDLMERAWNAKFGTGWHVHAT